MKISERPAKLKDLMLMRRLEEYGQGIASWRVDELDDHEKSECQTLYANLSVFVEKSLQPLLNRATSQEMRGFTMHDSMHGQKIAHLAWHILKEERRNQITPAEIALIILSAYIHDIGMALSDEDRKARLEPDSDLWDGLEPDSPYLIAIADLKRCASEGSKSDIKTQEALFQVNQAQEALLCADTRERHATKSRYYEIIHFLRLSSLRDPINVHDPNSVISFDGDSLLEKLVEICVSHNESAGVLLDRDSENPSQQRFPTSYPAGCCLCDTRMVAACLRICDIIDFDRERTPSVLFHYLLPTSSDPSSNVSIREWSKHLAISNWEIVSGQLIFRGRSGSAIIHHAIVKFCQEIQSELERTKAIFEERWPFVVEAAVTHHIEAVGYRYLPYSFSIDEEKIYSLVMGKNIYDNELEAVRELIQNAVDACRLRDAFLISEDPTVVPSSKSRISVNFDETGSSKKSPRLTVSDTGIGMDRFLIENFFLKVGRSFYSSNDFLKIKSRLQKGGLLFRPIAEFGVGFMSTFMIGQRIEVETAPWRDMRGDSLRRTLKIDGVGKLIEIVESQNNTIPRFYGTKIHVTLQAHKPGNFTFDWDKLLSYIQEVCFSIDFPITLERSSDSLTEAVSVEPKSLQVQVSAEIEDAAFHIDVSKYDTELLGEIVIFRAPEVSRFERSAAQKKLVLIDENNKSGRYTHEFGTLLRDGFKVGSVPGIPYNYSDLPACDAIIETKNFGIDIRTLPRTNLSRSRLLAGQDLENRIIKIWLSALLDEIEDIEKRPVGDFRFHSNNIMDKKWLQKFSGFDLYRLARSCWSVDIEGGSSVIQRWEDGEIIIQRDYHFGDLATTIFDAILPKICETLVDSRKTYLKAPKSGWKKELSNWFTFCDDKLSFGNFSEYHSSIGDCFYANHSLFLNEKFRGKFSGMTDLDVLDCRRTLDDLIRQRRENRRARLTVKRARMLADF